MTRTIRLAFLVAIFALATPRAQDPRQEESRDHFRKWLSQDVVYLITPEEKAVFQELTTDVEKERFIEQFWRRRDPDPTTAENEFKEEYYRRIAYANQWFKSGKAGWQTDRGRIYIMYGPPDGVESHPTGGTYQRPEHEGGGFTSTHPFEIWRYRHLEGIGDDIELEFVDPVGGAEYRLALDAEEKDALLHVPSVGFTRAEARGLASKRDRLTYSGRDAMNPRKIGDNLFDRYERYARVQVPQSIENADLQQMVRVDVSYTALPFQVRQDSFRLSEELELVPITLAVDTSELTYREENGINLGRATVYGLVTSIDDRIHAEFEDVLVSSWSAETPRGKRSVYQKIVTLPRGNRYKIDLVVRDVHSGKLGTWRKALALGSYAEDRLSASTVILSDLIHRLSDSDRDQSMFVLGDLWVRPSVDNAFAPGAPIGVYLQIYNAAEDSSTAMPDLHLVYRVSRAGETVAEIDDARGTSIYYRSPLRIVLVQPLPVDRLETGDYLLEILVEDRIQERQAAFQTRFTIAAQSAPASD